MPTSQKILLLPYKGRLVDAADGNNRGLLWERYETHKHTAWEKYRIKLCSSRRYIHLPLLFKGLDNSLNMKALGFSETLLNIYQIARFRTEEDHSLQP